MNSSNFIAIIADCHLGQYWRTNPKRALKLIDTFKNTLLDIKKTSDTLIILGDLYHSVNLPPDCLAYISNTIYPMFREFDTVSIVVGNHEVFLDVNNIQRSLPSLLLYADATIIEDPACTVMELGSTKFISLPHCSDMDGTITRMIGMGEAFKDSIILGHLTPKEIFERSKTEITPMIESLTPKAIILGDFHTPVYKKIGSTQLISVGSTYYWDISDVYKKAIKRYLTIDKSSLSIESHPIMLPTILSYKVDDISQLDTIFGTDKTSIYYIESSLPLDLTQYVIDGYDVYFNYLIKEKYETMADGITLDSSNFVSIDDSWEDYMKVQHYESNVKKIAYNIFKNRNTVNTESILAMLNNKGGDLQ